MIHFATSKHFLIETGNQMIKKVKNINPDHLILGSEVNNEESDIEMDEIDEDTTGITDDEDTTDLTDDYYDLTNKMNGLTRRRRKKQKGNLNCNSEVKIVKLGYRPCLS